MRIARCLERTADHEQKIVNPGGRGPDDCAFHRSSPVMAAIKIFAVVAVRSGDHLQLVAGSDTSTMRVATANMKRFAGE
jgi:hypothetical protein